jgi:hypothetical protein
VGPFHYKIKTKIEVWVLCMYTNSYHQRKLLMVFRSLQAILGFLWIVAVAFGLFNALMLWDFFSCYTKHEDMVRYCHMLTAIFALDMINATLSVCVHLISDLTLTDTVQLLHMVSNYVVWAASSLVEVGKFGSCP